MKALFTVEIGEPEQRELGRTELRDISMPEMKEDEVLIKVAYASICGSDAHMLRGELGSMRDMVIQKLPMPCGHEISGVIEQVGLKSAAAGFKPGDRVTANYSHFCGSCYYCRTGRENFCINPVNTCNAMSEYVCWHMSQIYKIPDNVDLKYAALTEPLSIAFGAVEMVNIHMGSSVAVFGGGGIGLMALQLARNAGAGKIVLVEPVPEKRQLALELGADEVWDPVNEDIVQKTNMYTEGLGFDSVIESSGASSAAVSALQVLSCDGDVVYFAMYKPEFNLEVNLFSELYLKQKHIHGMYTTADVFPRVIPMLSRINLEPIVQKVYPMSEHKTAFQDQLSGKFAKILFKCNDV